MKNKKGQFYIIGSLIIILLMFHARYSGMVSIEKPIDASQNLFSNVKSEYFNALDSSYASKQASGSMEDNITSFLGFLNNVSISHGQRFESLAVAFVPKGLNYNVSVWNFEGESVNVGVSLGGISQTLSLADKASGRLVFNDTTDFITATVNYTKTSGTTTIRFNITNRKLNGFIDIKMKTSKTTWSDTLTNMEEITV